MAYTVFDFRFFDFRQICSFNIECMYLQNFKENGEHPDEMAGHQSPPLDRYS